MKDFLAARLSNCHVWQGLDLPKLMGRTGKVMANMMKSVEAMKKQEKMLRETLLQKTAILLNQLLCYVPTNSLLLVNGVSIKVICGSEGAKSLLINNRPLSAPEDCQWVIENFAALTAAMEDLMNPEVDELLQAIGKTQELIRKVDHLNEGMEKQTQ
jgi:hypothetical protein